MESEQYTASEKSIGILMLLRLRRGRSYGQSMMKTMVDSGHDQGLLEPRRRRMLFAYSISLSRVSWKIHVCMEQMQRDQKLAVHRFWKRRHHCGSSKARISSGTRVAVGDRSFQCRKDPGRWKRLGRGLSCSKIRNALELVRGAVGDRGNPRVVST